MDKEMQQKAQKTSKRRTRSKNKQQIRKSKTNNRSNNTAIAEEREPSWAAVRPEDKVDSIPVPNQLRTASVNGVNKKGASLGKFSSIQEMGQYVKDFNAALNSISGNIDNVIGKYESMATKVKGAFDNVVDAVDGLKTAWSAAVQDFSKADSIGEKIKAAWGGANKVLEESKNCLNTMKESSDTLSKSMTGVGKLGAKMKIPGLAKVGKFAGPFKKLSGASGKLGGALKGLGGAMGAIDAIVQTWQTGWNLGKKLGEMLGLAKVFHNTLYGKQVEADKKKMAVNDKKIKVLSDSRNKKMVKFLLEDGILTPGEADEFIAAVNAQTKNAPIRSELNNKKTNKQNYDKKKYKEQEKSRLKHNKIIGDVNKRYTYKTTKDPRIKQKIAAENAKLRKQEVEKKYEQAYGKYSGDRAKAILTGKKLRQQYYISSNGKTPLELLVAKRDYYARQEQESKDFEARARANYEAAKKNHITPAMRNFGREGEQERARQAKIAVELAHTNSWIKDYKDLDKVANEEKSDKKITGYLDKIARNVIKIDQHTYGTKSNTEDMLRQMGHKESVVL